MKVDYCDEHNNAIIRVNKRELGIILGRRFGDRYGNGGEAFNKGLIGKTFDLSKLEQTQRCIKIAHELKTKTVRDISDFIRDFESSVNFCIPEIEVEVRENE